MVTVRDDLPHALVPVLDKDRPFTHDIGNCLPSRAVFLVQPHEGPIIVLSPISSVVYGRGRASAVSLQIRCETLSLETEEQLTPFKKDSTSELITTSSMPSHTSVNFTTKSAALPHCPWMRRLIIPQTISIGFGSGD